MSCERRSNFLSFVLQHFTSVLLRLGWNCPSGLPVKRKCTFAMTKANPSVVVNVARACHERDRKEPEVCTVTSVKGVLGRCHHLSKEERISLGSFVLETSLLPRRSHLDFVVTHNPAEKSCWLRFLSGFPAPLQRGNPFATQVPQSCKQIPFLSFLKPEGQGLSH